MPTLNLVPQLAPRLARKLLPSKDVAINSINISISALNDLISVLPERYGWRFKTAEAFNAEFKELAQSGAKIRQLNDLYWKDMLKNCEAYSIMCVWRMGDLAQSCAWALARNDINCSALTARAALEAAAQYVDTARTLSVTLEPIGAKDLVH